MYVLITYKNEEGQRKMNGLEWYIIELYFRHTRAANFIVDGQMWLQSKLVKALICVLDTCKMMEIHLKMKAPVCSQPYSHYKYMDFFFRNSRTANSIDPCSILLNFKPIQAYIAVLVTFKN